MGLFSRKSDNDIERTRANDIETAHRARKWGLPSAPTFEDRVVAADNELHNRRAHNLQAQQARTQTQSEMCTGCHCHYLDCSCS